MTICWLLSACTVCVQIIKNISNQQPQSHSFSLGLWILDLGLVFGTWIWDLDLGLYLGLTKILNFKYSVFLRLVPFVPRKLLLLKYLLLFLTSLAKLDKSFAIK